MAGWRWEAGCGTILYKAIKAACTERIEQRLPGDGGVSQALTRLIETERKQCTRGGWKGILMTGLCME